MWSLTPQTSMNAVLWCGLIVSGELVASLYLLTFVPFHFLTISSGHFSAFKVAFARPKHWTAKPMN